MIKLDIFRTLTLAFINSKNVDGSENPPVCIIFYKSLVNVQYSFEATLAVHQRKALVHSLCPGTSKLGSSHLDNRMVALVVRIELQCNICDGHDRRTLLYIAHSGTAN